MGRTKKSVSTPKSANVPNKISKNSIENYLCNVVDPILVERLREEISETVSPSKIDENLSVQRPERDEIQVGEEQHHELAHLKKQITVLTNERDEALKQCDTLKKENARLLKDNCAMKKIVDQSKSVDLYKDIKIQKLKASQNQTAANINDPASSKQLLFSEYAISHPNYFDQVKLRKLRSFSKGQPGDGQFITQLLKYVYNDDVKKIAGKCGGDKKVVGKTLVTPEKKSLIVSMLTKRFESENLTEEQFLTRTQRINRVIGNSIYTITRSGSTKKTIEAPESPEAESTSSPLNNFAQIPLYAQITTLPSAQPIHLTTSSTEKSFNFVSLTPVSLIQPNNSNVLFY